MSLSFALIEAGTRWALVMRKRYSRVMPAARAMPFIEGARLAYRSLVGE